MTNVDTTLETADEAIDRLGEWLRETRRLSGRLGRPDAAASAVAQFDAIDRPGVRIVVAGAVGDGDAQLLNRLFDAELLPTGATGARLARCEFTIEAATTAEETVRVDDGPDRGLRERSEPVGASYAPGSRVTVRLNRPLLTRRRATIVRAAPIDVREEEVREYVDRTFGAGDVAVLVLDAETPLRRVEQEVYRELRRRRMPTIVVVARMHLVAPGDRAELEDYLAGRLPDARQVPLAYFPDESGGAGEVEAALEGLLTEVRPPELRARLTALQLAATVDDLLALALAAEERQTRSESERAALARDRREKFERVDLVWHDVQLNLHRRRQRVEAPVREHLAAHRQTLLESLMYDLERTSDVKSWWERDLPFKLQREFRTLASQLSGMVNRQIETDTQWAREELQRRLEQSLPPAAARTTKLDADQPSLEQQPLANTETWKIASRLSTGAAVIAAATLFATAGVGGIAMAASIGAGVLAEQLLRMRTQRDRDTVRTALGDAVAQAELNYTVEVSRSLGAGYDALLEQLKSQQIRWQQTQLRALQELSTRPADADATAAAGAVGELRRLQRELRQALDA